MVRWLLLLLFLTGCIGPVTPDQPSIGLAADALFVDEAIAGIAASATRPIIGYLYANDQGVFLANQLILPTGIPPPPHGRDPPSIWIGESLAGALERALSNDSGAAYGAVQVRGRLEGPGSFGPDGRYQYHIDRAVLTALLPQEISMRDLIALPADTTQHLVQVEGDLLLNEQSVILFEQLGSGGVPIPDSRQIKLTYPSDPATLAGYLTGIPNSSIHAGPVRIVGVWHQHVLRPLAYIPLDS